MYPWGGVALCWAVATLPACERKKQQRRTTMGTISFMPPLASTPKPQREYHSVRFSNAMSHVKNNRDAECPTEVILLAGLPGCGKTTRLCQMCRDGWLVFDDFKADAFDDSSDFRKSRKFSALIVALRDGLRCVLADIDFCRMESRRSERVLRSEAPGVKLSWYFFANNCVACERNVIRRNRESLQADLEELRKYSTFYFIPPCCRAPHRRVTHITSVIAVRYGACFYGRASLDTTPHTSRTGFGRWRCRWCL